MTTLQFKPHTIIMLVGPEQAGKTKFAKEVLIPQLKNHTHTRVNYISSDELRKTLDGYADKDYTVASRMLSNSKAAFELLQKQLEMYTSYPVNNEFVIVDTKGLSESFRNQVLAVGRNNHYHVAVVAFDYKERSDYGPQVVTDELREDTMEFNRELTKQLKRLRKDTMKTLSKSKYDKIYTLKSRMFDVQVEIENHAEYVSHFLPTEYNYKMIGDTHGCFDELKELLVQCGAEIVDNRIVSTSRPNERFVSVGDYLDKGEQTEEIIRFLHANQEYIKLVIGNHENYIYRVLTGAVPPEKLTAKKRYYFNSIPLLEENTELREMFFDLYKGAKAFYHYAPKEGNEFYVTHAPCRQRYIGKIDKVSLDKQINLSIEYEEKEDLTATESLENQLQFLKESEFNSPYHFFGHVAVESTYQVGRSIGIDTGVVFGGKLTCVDVSGYRPFYKSTKKQGDYKFRDLNQVPYELVSIFSSNLKSFDLEKLTRRERGRLVYSAHKKVNFVAGTISPAPKNETTRELESLDAAYAYFAEKGIDKLVMQKKYMGSRCQFYITDDVKTSFAVSRGGYRISDDIVDNLLEEAITRYKPFMDAHNLGLLVTDGELMPWAALGEGLIEEQFVSYSKLVESELSALSDLGFDEQYMELSNKFDGTEAQKDLSTLTKKAYIEKHGNHVHQTLRALAGYEHVTKEDNVSGLAVFNEQLENFGEVATPYYLPFDILKAEDKNGDIVEFNFNTEERYSAVSDDEYLVIDLSDSESRKNGMDFFNALIYENGMEGIVLKPLNLVDGVVPYMKVRSPRYLTIVYGHDYLTKLKYDRLFEQKDITRKVRLSKKEAEYGRTLLQIPQKTINMENKGYVKLTGNLLLELREAENIDPRL